MLTKSEQPVQLFLRVESVKSAYLEWILLFYKSLSGLSFLGLSLLDSPLQSSFFLTQEVQAGIHQIHEL